MAARPWQARSDALPKRCWLAFLLGGLRCFLLALLFAGLLGGVSCAKVTATQPRASERPSINVISFFMSMSPGQVRLNRVVQEKNTGFSGKRCSGAQLKWLHLKRPRREGEKGDVAPDCVWRNPAVISEREELALGAIGLLFLGRLLLAGLLGGVVSWANETATQPRASERPSIIVINFFIAKNLLVFSDVWASLNIIIADADVNDRLTAQLKQIHLTR